MIGLSQHTKFEQLIFFLKHYLSQQFEMKASLFNRESTLYCKFETGCLWISYFVLAICQSLQSKEHKNCSIKNQSINVCTCSLRKVGATELLSHTCADGSQKYSHVVSPGLSLVSCQLWHYRLRVGIELIFFRCASAFSFLFENNNRNFY